MDNLNELKEAETKKNRSMNQVNNLLIYMRQIANHHMLLSADYCTDNFRSKTLFKQLALTPCNNLNELVKLL